MTASKSSRTRIIKIVSFGASVICLFLMFNLNGILYVYSLYARDVANTAHPDPPFKTCETYPSQDRGIRIAASYDYSQSLVGATYVFFLTEDRGAAWRQVYSFRLDEPWEPNCQNLNSLNDRLTWIWIGKALFFVTHDGGETWTKWTPNQTWSNSERTCRDGVEIQGITFEGEEIGYMKLRPICEISELYSEDGGVSWRKSTR
jgi:photosystem II stability/assembly factor-like uncharacterized protein